MLVLKCLLKIVLTIPDFAYKMALIYHFYHWEVLLTINDKLSDFQTIKFDNTG